MATWHWPSTSAAYHKSGGERELDLIDRDVEAALEFLKDKGATTIFLIGASMGGTACLKVAARREKELAGVVSLSAPVEFRGISVEGEKVRVPTLLLATRGDGSAKRNLETMIRNDIVGGPELTNSVVYEGGDDHGTDILKGENAGVAMARILGFLEARSR